MRASLRAAIAHLEHVLPDQAPIRDFVHHNTLHGFQHLPFRDAIVAAAGRIGARGFLPLEDFRQHYRRGRITEDDLKAALRSHPELGPGHTLELGLTRLLREDVYSVALLHKLEPISPPQLRFQIEELGALKRFHAAIPPASRSRLLESAQSDEKHAVSDLWDACLNTLGIEYQPLHPEAFTRADVAADDGGAGFEDAAGRLLDRLIAHVGEDWTLREFLQALTGEDLMTHLRPTLLRHLGSHLDQGMAPWHNPDRDKGFYCAWRTSIEDDLIWGLIDLTEWHQIAERLPDNALDTVIQELRLLGLPEEKWPRYLERLALELPGWSGMFSWRQRHPSYSGVAHVPVSLVDYLAVRLVFEQLFAHGMCRRRWQVEPNLAAIRRHFDHHPAELLVRHALYSERLPEHLITLARQLTQQATFSIEPLTDAAWQEAAKRIAAWERKGAAGRALQDSAHGAAWPVFVLCQHLGISGQELRTAGEGGARALLQCLRRLDADTAGYLWLLAYERHYRDEILGALLANHGRGALPTLDAPPEAQLVFCMDDREEGIRRHLEQINPALETFGAAGFFGMAVNWRGLDDTEVTALCPVVVTPAHEAREVPQPGAQEDCAWHERRRATRLRWKRRLHEGTRRGVLGSAAVLVAAAPVSLAALAAKVLAPTGIGRLAVRLRTGFDIEVPTRVAFEAPADSPPATPSHPRFGFTDIEQADRVEGLLRTIGLTSGFAPLVVILGHGSSSQNNPHMAAYDCGACSGRHGGPNARLFAAMANRPAVRSILAERGLTIPQDTWFMGGQRNTGTSTVTWFDRDLLPKPLQEGLLRLDGELVEAAHSHALERCRRFASAPASPSPEQAYRHVIERSFDFSQARPELGHVTNAAAFIGRRAMSRGAFFDRRAFLISYDPTQDPEGTVLEAILLAAGPVGAGISLEYYFSTVNNEHFGCGTKVVHNVAGLFGVMEGASSDLRTGLPRQMIEIHEAMRLLIVVEHYTRVLDAIYARQPALKELIGNAWVQLAVKHPETPEIRILEPGHGWIPFEDCGAAIPTVSRWEDWYAGHTEGLSPALIAQPANREMN